MYLECSAFLGEGVEEIFKTASKSILNKVENGVIQLDDGKSNITNRVNILKKEPEIKSYKSCENC